MPAFSMCAYDLLLPVVGVSLYPPTTISTFASSLKTVGYPLGTFAMPN